MYAPGVERLAERLSRGTDRLTGAIAAAGLLVGGSMVMGFGGWHRVLGMTLVILGVLGCLAVAVGAWRSSRQK